MFGGPCCLYLEDVYVWSWDVCGFVEEWLRDQVEGNSHWPFGTWDEVGLSRKLEAGHSFSRQVQKRR
jgi:hypothetical protein